MEKQIPEKPSSEHEETNIDGDVSGSVIISGNGNVVNVGGEKPSKRIRRKNRAKSQKVNWSNPAIVAAVIAAIATIIASLLMSPFLAKWLEPNPTPTATASSTLTEPASATPMDSPTVTEYFSPTPIVLVVTSTESPVTASPTFTPNLENTTTPEPRADNMTALLQSTVDNGKAPLMVNFDARSSYVEFADGNMVLCGNNTFCSYSFAIYRDSKFVDRVSTNTGVLSYTFGAKGKYFVTVYVCRGEACNDDGVTVVVR